MTDSKLDLGLLSSPVLLLLTSIFGIVLLVVGFVVLWALHLLTGVIIAVVLLVIVWTLIQTKALPTDKYPWAPLLLVFLPIIGFFVGIVGDRTGAFVLTPIMEKAEAITPYYSGQEAQWIQTNPETILISILLLCIFVVLIKSGRK
jgi:hypothetical protein